MFDIKFDLIFDPEIRQLKKNIKIAYNDYLCAMWDWAEEDMKEERNSKNVKSSYKEMREKKVKHYLAKSELYHALNMRGAY